MENLERYFKQFEQLLQNIIQDGEIDEYDDGEVMLSIHQFEQDETKIAEIISKKPGLRGFYSKPKPIQVVEKSEDGLETFSEDMSIRVLSEYLQEHSEFEFAMSQESSFSEYITTRFRSIAEQIGVKLNNGLQIPYLEKGGDTVEIFHDELENNSFSIMMKHVKGSERRAIGYISYDKLEDNFSMLSNNGEIENMSIYDAMPLVFNYIYQRKNLAHFRSTNNEKGINEIPLGYREPVKYRGASEEIIDDTDFWR